MKKYLLLASIVLAVTIPSVSWSQATHQGGGNNGGMPAAGMPPMEQHQGEGQRPEEGQRHEEREQRFEEHKAEMLRHIDEHLAEVQHRKVCVEAARDHDALRACMPERGGENRGNNENQGHNENRGGNEKHGNR